MCTVLLPPGVNPIAFNKYINIWPLLINKILINSILTYTGCPRRNVQYFGRVFLMLNDTDITQNTYIQS